MVSLLDQVGNHHKNEFLCWTKVNYNLLITSVNSLLTLQFIKIHIFYGWHTYSVAVIFWVVRGQLHEVTCIKIRLTSFYLHVKVCFLSSFISIATLKYVRIFNITYFVTATFSVVLSQIHESSRLKIWLTLCRQHFGFNSLFIIQEFSNDLSHMFRLFLVYFL